MDNGQIINYINFTTKEHKRIFILDPIGQGKFGIVYKSVLEGYGPVAVKHQKMSPSVINALNTEMKVSQKLSPKVAFILRKILLPIPLPDMPESDFVSVSADVPDESVLSVYDLADGVSLSDLIRFNKSKIDVIIMDRYIQELLVCLNALEIAGVAHRDLKPENFMLDKGRIKLIDFGFACFFTTCRGQNGTANFLPPEFFVQPQLTHWHKADIFALAVTMICLLCNNTRLYEGLPFQSLEKAKLFFRTTSVSKLNEIFNTKLKDLVSRFPLLSRYYELLSHMLDANPDTRWTISRCIEWLKKAKMAVADDLQSEFVEYETQRQAQLEKEKEEEEQQKKLAEEMGSMFV